MRFRIPPSQEALQALHDDGYQKFYGDDAPEYAAAHLEKLRDRVRYLQGHIAQGAVLDIGCSTGLLMMELARAGFLPHGCDVSREACAASRKSFSEDRICQGTTTQALRYFGAERFDAVTLMDVLEHFDDAASGLKAISALLKPGGILFLRTPSLSSPFFRIADWSYKMTFGRYKRAVQMIYHAEHIYFFTEKGLRMLLEETGFEVLAVAPDPLPWRTFRQAELNYGLAVNTALALVYFLSRAAGGGHGVKIIARRRKDADMPTAV